MALEFGDDAFTPAEAQPIALLVGHHLEHEGFRVHLERALDDAAPYRTTIHATLNGLAFLVEAQNAPAFTDEVGGFATWLDVNRSYAQLYVAVTAEDDSSVSGRMLQQLRRSGTGLILVDPATGDVEISFEARNPALVVTLDPMLALGRCKPEVNRCLKEFNEGGRKAGLRDMFEIVERETKSLALRAARRNWINRTEAQVNAMDWSNAINIVSAQDQVSAGKNLLVDPNLKIDLQSFRGARNLVDHPPENKRADIQRQRQFAERMMAGPRLTARLLSISRTIR